MYRFCCSVEEILERLLLIKGRTFATFTIEKAFAGRKKSFGGLQPDGGNCPPSILKSYTKNFRLIKLLMCKPKKKFRLLNETAETSPHSGNLIKAIWCSNDHDLSNIFYSVNARECISSLTSTWGSWWLWNRNLHLTKDAETVVGQRGRKSSGQWKLVKNKQIVSNILVSAQQQC